jgi:hypothetical protein
VNLQTRPNFVVELCLQEVVCERSPEQFGSRLDSSRLLKKAASCMTAKNPRISAVFAVLARGAPHF